MSRFLTTGLLALCCIWLIWSLGSLNTFPPVDSWSLQSDQSQTSAWAALLDFRSNAFLSWRTDPWAQQIGMALSPRQLPTSYQLGLLVIFLSGFMLLLSAATYRTPLECLAGSMLATVAMVSLAGSSTIVWGSLAWVPWLAVSILLARRSGELFVGVFILFFALRTISAAAHLAPFSLLLSALLAHLPSSSTAPTQRHRALTCWCWIVLLLSYLLVLIQVEQSPLPDYPSDARVIHEIWWSGFIRPLFGFDYLIPLVNRSLMQQELLKPFAVLLCLSLAAYHLGSPNSVVRRSAGLAIAASAVGIWDSIPLQELWQIGPVAASSRLLPGLNLVHLAAVLLVAAILPLAIALTARLGAKLIPTTVLTITIIA
ncbi:MAG: hypothetical protein EBZ48_02540, partial [Proteobacteria bacterium]|nr:hypothetical protein [Pseudomonadota bacterium]